MEFIPYRGSPGASDQRRSAESGEKPDADHVGPWASSSNARYADRGAESGPAPPTSCRGSPGSGEERASALEWSPRSILVQSGDAPPPTSTDRDHLARDVRVLTVFLFASAWRERGASVESVGRRFSPKASTIGQSLTVRVASTRRDAPQLAQAPRYARRGRGSASDRRPRQARRLAPPVPSRQGPSQ
jgi:hypothetical protein